MATRWVVVDDTHTDEINYVGDSWFADVGSQDSLGNFGPPYKSTMHGTLTSAILTFNFTGTSVRVIGSNNIRNDSGVVDPQWSCSVDGVGITAGLPYQYPENNWNFCTSSTLSDGPHKLTLTATVAKRQTLWIDHIDYVPSSTVSLSNKTIWLASTDPAIQLGNGWNSYADIGNWTQTQGALAVMNFYGTSVSWYGHIPTEWSGNATTGTWAIDNNTPQTFLLKGHVNGSNVATAYNEKFFETSSYPNGLHTLTVTYNGDSSKTPLVLGSLYIQNNTVVTSNSTSNSTSTSPSSTPGSNPSHNDSPIGAIVGGVLGGVVVLLVVALIFLYRRRKRKAEEDRITVDEPMHYVSVPQHIPNFYDRSPSQLLPPDIHPISSGLSSNNTDTTLYPRAGLGVTHSRKPSESRLSDTTSSTNAGHVPAGGNFVVLNHQDSGTRLPSSTPARRVDIPPAYTED